MKEELFLDSAEEFPKRSQSIASLQTIRNYTKSVMNENNIHLENIHVMPVIPQIPRWEQQKGNFDIEYTNLSKSSDTNELISIVRERIDNKYSHHLKVYTDGSVLESSDAGAGIVIPDAKICRKYYIGRDFSIFTAELYAILMALRCIIEHSLSPFCILFCVDSKSVLHALQNDYSKVRPDIVLEIHHLVHVITINGIGIDFCWVPSHCGLYWNEVVDKLARNAAVDKVEISHNLTPSSYEIIANVVQSFRKKMSVDCIEHHNCPQHLCSLLHKLRLNSWRTKYCKNVRCVCNDVLSIQHILFECTILTDLYQEQNIFFDNNLRNVSDFLSNKNGLLIPVLDVIFQSDVYNRL